MKDYINEFCSKKKIKPVYTENKLTILSNGSQNGTPVLRIHKIFNNCPRKTAQAIVDYYLDIEKREEYYKQIQNHAMKYLGACGYKVAPLGDNFMNALILNHNNGEGNLKPELTEHSIISLTKKGFEEKLSMKVDDGIIAVREDNMIELDIIVDK